MSFKVSSVNSAIRVVHLRAATDGFSDIFDHILANIVQLSFCKKPLDGGNVLYQIRVPRKVMNLPFLIGEYRVSNRILTHCT